MTSSIVSGRPGIPHGAGEDDSGIQRVRRWGLADDGPRQAGPDAGRPGSGASRQPAGLAWLAIVTAVVVAGAGAFGIARLQASAAQRQEMRTMLADIKASAWEQSALESQAAADRRQAPELARQHQASHLVVHALAEKLAEQDPGSVESRAVQASFDEYYHHALENEFTFLESGRVDDAAQVKKAEVDPAFHRLINALNAADRAYGLRAAEASSQARMGTILILATTAMITGGLVWLQRAGSRAYGHVAHRASHDALTGLPNRSLLHERTAEAIRRAARTGSSAAVLIIDLDRFKQVNDTLGHHCGDQLLIEVARRMREALGPGDTVARLGGDEFALLLPRVAATAEVVAAADRLDTALRAPFLIEGVSLTVEASIGAALYPEHGADADELLRHADATMYAAKTRA